MPTDITLTPELLTEVSKLSGKDRKHVMNAVGVSEYARCADDMMYWLDASRHVVTEQWPKGFPYVFTKDPHPMYKCRTCHNTTTFDKRDIHLKLFHDTEASTEAEYRAYFEVLSPIRAFTIMPYMPPLISWWLREPLFLIEKSRDMMATWLIVTLYTWDSLFHQVRQNIFQSEDASKTRELVERASFIYHNQPPFLRNVHKAYYTTGGNRSGELKIPSIESEILGFPQGPNQIRQFHPSGVFQDEAAFQIQAADAFAAIKPAIQNGGRFTAVSSACPSWFQHVAADDLDYM